MASPKPVLFYKKPNKKCAEGALPEAKPSFANFFKSSGVIKHKNICILKSSSH